MSDLRFTLDGTIIREDKVINIDTVDSSNTMTIGNFRLSLTCKNRLAISHKNYSWFLLKQTRLINKKLVLVYDDTLYSYNYFHELCLFEKFEGKSGNDKLIKKELSWGNPRDLDDLRILIIRYLRKIGREYDPSLMRYPEIFFSRVSRVIPIRYSCGNFADVHIIAKID